MDDKPEILKSPSPENQSNESADFSAKSEFVVSEISAKENLDKATIVKQEDQLDSLTAQAQDSIKPIAEPDLSNNQDKLVRDCVIRTQNNFKKFKKRPYLSRKKFIQCKNEYQKLSAYANN